MFTSRFFFDFSRFYMYLIHQLHIWFQSTTQQRTFNYPGYVDIDWRSRLQVKVWYLIISISQVYDSYIPRGAPVAQSVERWTCDWKVAGSNLGMKGPYGTISIFSAPYAVPVFRKRHKTKAPSQSPNGAGSLN